MAMQPKHILVAVLDWGLGHATRSMVVINALLKDGYKVSIAGNGQSLELLKQEYLHLNYYELEPYDVTYSSSGSFMLNIFWQLPKFLKAIQTEHQQIEQLQSNLKLLEDLAFGVMKDEDARLAYEDATHIYWALFMTLVDRGGTDNLCDLRFKALIDIIGKYESILHLPGLDTAYHCAFAQVSKAIQEGKYSKEDFKNLLKVHENGTEETKG